MGQQMISQADLQYIEHANKLLREHDELWDKVTQGSKVKAEEHLRTLRDYVKAVDTITFEMGRNVSNILKSMVELKGISGKTNELIALEMQLRKLNQTLTESKDMNERIKALFNV